MPRVRYVGNAGRYRLTNSSVDVEAGEATVVDEDMAEYLLARNDFEPVEDEPEEVDPPLNPGEFAVDSLREALAESDYSDAELDAIADVETANKDRATAHDAIDAARED